MNYYMSYLATVWLCGCVIWPTLYVLVIFALFCFVLNKGVWYTFAIHFIRYTRSTQGLRSAWVPGLTFVLRTALINYGEKSTIDKWNSSDILTQIDIIGLRSCCRFVYCLHIHVAKLPFHRWFQILTPPSECCGWNRTSSKRETSHFNPFSSPFWCLPWSRPRCSNTRRK